MPRKDTSKKEKEILKRTAFNSRHIELYYDGGGEVPKMLKGLYTDKFAADQAISQYLRLRDGDSKASKNII